MTGEMTGKNTKKKAAKDKTRRLPYRVFVHDLMLPCRIGVHQHEQGAHQRVRINLDLAVEQADAEQSDDIHRVVCYEELVWGVRRIVESEHIHLVETLAERIARMCLTDSRVRRARIRVEKLDAIDGAASAGVEIERPELPS
jgi:dihydroneopterin aldolase